MDTNNATYDDLKRIVEEYRTTRAQALNIRVRTTDAYNLYNRIKNGQATGDELQTPASDVNKVYRDGLKELKPLTKRVIGLHKHAQDLMAVLGTTIELESYDFLSPKKGARFPETPASAGLSGPDRLNPAQSSSVNIPVHSAGPSALDGSHISTPVVAPIPEHAPVAMAIPQHIPAAAIVAEPTPAAAAIPEHTPAAVAIPEHTPTATVIIMPACATASIPTLVDATTAGFMPANTITTALTPADTTTTALTPGDTTTTALMPADTASTMLTPGDTTTTTLTPGDTTTTTLTPGDTTTTALMSTNTTTTTLTPADTENSPHLHLAHASLIPSRTLSHTEGISTATKAPEGLAPSRTHLEQDSSSLLAPGSVIPKDSTSVTDGQLSLVAKQDVAAFLPTSTQAIDPSLFVPVRSGNDIWIFPSNPLDLWPPSAPSPALQLLDPHLQPPSGPPSITEPVTTSIPVKRKITHSTTKARTKKTSTKLMKSREAIDMAVINSEDPKMPAYQRPILAHDILGYNPLDVLQRDRQTGDLPDPDPASDVAGSFDKLPDRLVFYEPLNQNAQIHQANAELIACIHDGIAVSAASRKLIRTEAAVLPRAMLYNRQTSLHMLSTLARNILCPYHGNTNKAGKSHDTASPEARNFYRVTGTPYARNVSTLKKDGVATRAPGHLHCGCPEDYVLLKIILWKLTKVKSYSTGAEETGQDMQLGPRERAFMMQAFMDWSGLTPDDFFAVDAFGNTRTYGDLLRKQIAVLQGRLDRYEAAVKAARQAELDKDEQDLLAAVQQPVASGSNVDAMDTNH